MYVVEMLPTEMLLFPENSNGQKTCMTLIEFLNYDMQAKLMVCIALPPMGEQSIFKSYKVIFGTYLLRNFTTLSSSASISFLFHFNFIFISFSFHFIFISISISF